MTTAHTKPIVIRQPNWLGDIMMSLPMVAAVGDHFPEREVYVIIKKEYAGLVSLMPGIAGVFPFNKKEYAGIKGLWKFGRKIKNEINPELFFVLPDSFSSAWMAFASGADHRIGYKGQNRNLFLTEKYVKPAGLHRAREYLFLAEKYLNKKINLPEIQLTVKSDSQALQRKVLLNINSEAQSRRLPLSLADDLLANLIDNEHNEIYLSGGPRDVEYVSRINPQLLSHPRVHNMAGKTSLNQLFDLISSMDATISADSGIAHVANAFGIRGIVLFGAGNERNTAPVNADLVTIYRLPDIPCAPCLKNTCRYGTPFCLGRMQAKEIVKLISN